mgnify:CR=1 FL=1
MRWSLKRIRGYQTRLLPGWWDYLRLRPIPFAAWTLWRAIGARARVAPGGRPPVLAYERGKGRRVERERTERLLRLFRSIQGFDPATARLLCVGPRGVAEILLLRLYGFRRIDAIDLISRDPLIQAGDMHAVPFGDAAFEVVYSAFTLTYGDPARALAEFRRVLKPSGLVALAWGQASARIVHTAAGEFSASPLSPEDVFRYLLPSHVYWWDSKAWDGGTATHYLLLRL